MGRPDVAPMHETVVLAHGLSGHPILMRLLGRRLQSHGFATRNWGYPSIIGSVERHAAKLREVLDELDSDPAVSRIHLVRLEPLDGIDVGVMGATLDLVVPASKSHMPGEREHRIYSGLHHQVLFRMDVAKAVARFLQTGAFPSRQDT